MKHLQNPENNIYRLLDTIRRRPGLYIGHHSPTHLNAFLAGYQLGVGLDKEFKEDPDFGGFPSYVAEKFGYTDTSSGWAYMIEDQREDQEEALWLFFELLDDYRGIKHKEIARTRIRDERKIDRSWSAYSRLKKIRGSFEAVEKPAPKELVILKIELIEQWFSLVAYGKDKEMLFSWQAHNLKDTYQRAFDIFGIDKNEWL